MVTELAKEDDNAPASPAMPDMGGMGGMGMACNPFFTALITLLQSLLSEALFSLL